MFSKRVMISCICPPQRRSGVGLRGVAAPHEETLPVTTSSVEARHEFDQGLARFQNDLRT